MLYCFWMSAAKYYKKCACIPVVQEGGTVLLLLSLSDVGLGNINLGIFIVSLFSNIVAKY